MAEGGSLVDGITFLIILTALDAIMFGFGAAAQSISEMEVSLKAQEGDRKSLRLLRFIENPSYLIAAVHTISMLTGITAGMFTVTGIRGFLAGLMIRGIPAINTNVSDAVSLVLAVFSVMFIMLAFGVLIPKRIGIKRCNQLAYFLVSPVNFIIVLFSPFIWLVVKFGENVVSVFGISPFDEAEDVTEEEIIYMVNEGHEQGVLQASEAQMINNIIEFADKEAKDIMTHRKNMIALDGEMTLDDALAFILNQRNSRFPVYDGNLDNIIGVLHLKNAMKSYSHPEMRGMSIMEIEGLVREADFIPETRNINLLFKNMQSQNMHMVIVVDEYGQTAGLVAMEDILEEIVGNIMDEYDIDDSNIIEQSDETFMMEGSTPLEEVELALGLQFEDEDYETLNGFLISKIDRIPEEDEVFEIEHEGYRFHIMSVENKMIRSVHVSRIAEEKNQPADTTEDEE
ncbi:putative hemolysin [Anaerobium acetethylicum]|uniref:Putative hemolysin n=2 Tax=Anaerobium acetethylicum TaxID=1619234 RepID=A0A1D3TP79_9FIRM|nr:putative hemolysin [Anaerobium acetethylicum]